MANSPSPAQLICRMAKGLKRECPSNVALHTPMMPTPSNAKTRANKSQSKWTRRRLSNIARLPLLSTGDFKVGVQDFTNHRCGDLPSPSTRVFYYTGNRDLWDIVGRKCNEPGMVTILTRHDFPFPPRTRNHL